MKNIESYMKLSILEAKNAALRGSVPVGAVIVYNGDVIASAGNEVRKNVDVTSHAEIVAIRRASMFIESIYLQDCDMYVTLEPCAMCAQAISFSRIKRLYFGAYDTKYGGVDHGAKIFQHALCKPEVIGGVCEEECSEIIRNFFRLKQN